MTFAFWTRIFIFVVIAFIAAWDMIAIIHGGNASISVAIWTWSANYPVVPFVGGFLSAHLFWQSDSFK